MVILGYTTPPHVSLVQTFVVCSNKVIYGPEDIPGVQPSVSEHREGKIQLWLDIILLTTRKASFTKPLSQKTDAITESTMGQQQTPYQYGMVE